MVFESVDAAADTYTKAHEGWWEFPCFSATRHPAFNPATEPKLPNVDVPVNMFVLDGLRISGCSCATPLNYPLLTLSSLLADSIQIYRYSPLLVEMKSNELGVHLYSMGRLLQGFIAAWWVECGAWSIYGYLFYARCLPTKAASPLSIAGQPHIRISRFADISPI